MPSVGTGTVSVSSSDSFGLRTGFPVPRTVWSRKRIDGRTVWAPSSPLFATLTRTVRAPFAYSTVGVIEMLMLPARAAGAMPSAATRYRKLRKPVRVIEGRLTRSPTGGK